MSPLFVPLTALLLLAMISPAPGADRPPADRTYIVRLERPATKGKAGATDLLWTATETIKVTYDDRPNDPEITETTRETRLIADVEILTVGSDARVTVEVFTIRSLTATTPDAPSTELLPPGTKLTARRIGKDTLFTVNNRPAPQNVKDALFRLVSLKPRSAVDDDVIFGTTEPRRMNQVWEVNRAAAAEAFRYHDNLVLPKDVSGTGRITGAETFNGIDCVRVVAEMHVKRLVELGSRRPAVSSRDPNSAAAAAEYATMTSTLEWLSPLTEQGGSLASTATAEKTFHSTARTPDGRSYRRERTLKERWETRPAAGP